MTPCLQDLSFDVLHQIAPNLDAREYTNLSLTNKTLARHLEDNGTARKALKAHYAYGSAGRHALVAGPAFRRELSRLHYRREALRTARPYSISHIADATSFAYDESTLVYTTAQSIRILDLSQPNAAERVINNRFLTSKLPFAGPRSSSLLPDSTTILAFKANTLAVLGSYGPAIGDYLFALNVQPGNIRQRCFLATRLRSTLKLFCLLSPTHLYYGTQSASSGQGYPEWLVQGFALDTNHPGQPISTDPIQLGRLAGLDPSSTITFVLHKDHFIALTNQTGHEAEEVNWTSYWRYIAFPVESAKPDLTIKKLFRRQDHEGPINDTWTELKFEVDEASGELILIEGRKEWSDHKSDGAAGEGWERTWYSVPWEAESTRHSEWEEDVSVAPGDALGGLVARTTEERESGEDEEVNTRWEQGDIGGRKGRWCHCEKGGKEKEYIRAKTKFSSYDFNRGCGVELVVDDVLPEDGGWRTRERLRVRVVSRLEGSSLVHTRNGVDESEQRMGPPGMLPPREKNQDGIPIQGSELCFKDSEIHLWPANDTKGGLQERGDKSVWAEIQELMCPGGRTGEVKGVLGEEGVVYSVGAPGPGGEKRLIFVCFDPAWGFEGLRGPDGEEVRPKMRNLPDWSSCDETHGDSRKGKRKAEIEEGRAAAEQMCAVKRPRSESASPLSPTAGSSTAMLSKNVATLQSEFSAALSKAHKQGHGHPRHDSGVAGLSDSTSDAEYDIDSDTDMKLESGDLNVLTPQGTANSAPISPQGNKDVSKQTPQSCRTAASPSLVGGTPSSSMRPEVMLALEEAMYLRLRRGFWVR